MGQISAYQEAPYQGISQAPPQVRRRDQASALEDYIVAIPEGAQKRPPFQYLGVLAGHNGSSDGVFHRVERSAGDAIFTITSEAGVSVPRVYDLATLAAQAVTIDAATQTYVNAITTPHHDLGCNTVADFTFTWNRTEIVANSATVNASRPYEALVWVRGGAYAKTYKVKVTGASSVTAFLHTPDGTTASDGAFVDTEVIAAALISGAYGIATDGATHAGALSSLSGFTVTQIGPVISITHPTVDFTVEVTDGQGGAAMIAAKGRVQKFSDLPARAPPGFTVRIIQQSGTNQDDYYLKFAETAGPGTGVWEECLAPGAPLGLDPVTMPMGLVNDGGWKFKVLSWKQRTTGDDTLVKDPDFIGQAVQDTCFWQGRLGIVSGEGVTLSCADDPFQLYPRTLALVLDSDPIGRINPAPGETTFRNAIPFEHRLVLVGDTIQAEVTDDGILTPSKASIDVMTEHEVIRYIRPSAVNGKLYFATPKGATAAAITEIEIDRYTNKPVGDDLSTAAFKYLPAGIDRSAVCPVSYISVYGVSGTADLYLHLFRHDNQERIQNAFERWHLPPGFTLGGMFFRNTTLYVLACNGGVGHLLKMDLSPLVLDADTLSTIQTHLDLKTNEAGVSGLAYNAGTNRTTMTLPYARGDTTKLVVRAPGAGAFPEGYTPAVDLVASVAAGANKLVVAGDLTTVPFYVGYTYTSRWDLSRIYPLDRDNKPLRNGRCNIRRLVLDLANTGYIRAEVKAAGRPTQVYEYFGFNWDDPAAHYDQAPSATTQFAFPVMCQNEQVEISLINDSPFGHTITGYEWTAEFNPKSQRT